MSTDEERLARWLKDHTPQPPRPLVVDDAPPRAVSAPRGWPRVLAATAVVVTVAAAVAGVAVARHSTAPATSTASVTPTRATPTRTTPRTSTPSVPPAAVRIDTPWGGTVLAGAAAHADPLLIAGDSLYARDNNELYRLSASTGAVRARTTIPDVGREAVMAGGALWLAPASGATGAGSAATKLTTTLTGYDPNTLRPTRHVIVSQPDGPDVLQELPIAAPESGDRLYVGVGNAVLVIDPREQRILNRLAVQNGSLVDVAVSPDGESLYTAQSHPNNETGTVQSVDPRTGSIRATRTTGLPIDNNIGLVASKGGVWVHGSGGHLDSVSFFRTAGLTLGDSSAASIIQSRPSSVSVSGGVVWLGGPNAAGCANPESGRRLTQIQLPMTPDGGTAELIDLQAAGGYLYGFYLGDDPGGVLTRFTRPARCA